MASPYVIAYVAIGLLGLIYLALLHFLFERLASHHSSTWQTLGSPQFFSNLQLGTLGKVIRFVARGEYRLLQDATLNLLCVSAAVLLAVCIVGSFCLQFVFYRGGGRFPAA